MFSPRDEKKDQINEDEYDDDYPVVDPQQHVFANGSVINLAELQSSGSSVNLTTYRWNGANYPILRNQTVAYLARRILNSNLDDGFTLGVYCGKSGSGKSTLHNSVNHRIHKIIEKKKLPAYVNKWYRRKEIENIDAIIASLPRGLNYILNFEDASFTFNNMSESEIEEQMQRWTYIRHEVKGNVIMQLQMHYSKALGPFMRDGDFTCFTSISPVERENMYKMFGFRNRSIVDSFFKKFGSMRSERYYYMPFDESQNFCYYAKKPFKIALVSDFNELHFINYPKESCSLCEPQFEGLSTKFVDSASEKEMLRELSEGYTLTIVKQILRDMLFFKGGADVLEPRYKSVYHRLSTWYEKHGEEYQSLLSEAKVGRSIDYILRQRGILNGSPTRSEMRAARRHRDRMRKRQTTEENHMDDTNSKDDNEEPVAGEFEN